MNSKMKAFVWIPVGVLIFSSIMILLIHFGYIKDNSHNEDLENQIPFYFTWNGHSYYKFDWGNSAGIVHNPDCICSNSRDYQVELDGDSIYIYDKQRVLEARCFDTCNELDLLLLNDNL